MDFVGQESSPEAPKRTKLHHLFQNFKGGGMLPDPSRLFWIHILYRLATRLQTNVLKID